MKKLFLLSACASLAIACGSPTANNTAANRSNSSASNTEAIANSYSRSENAYTFAQISDLAYDLTPSGKEARKIVGKTVSESKLWQNKKFDRRLRKLMGPDYATMKKYWNAETPIKKFGDFLMMTGCEQQNCADNQYVIFIDLGDGRINVVHIGKDATREWNAYREIDFLPPPFADELAELKSKK
jgi:hypothetical protein